MSVFAVAYPRCIPNAIERYDSFPAPPPLPVPRNLPFQFFSGIHSSIRMFESDVGRSVAATWQNGGKLTMGEVSPGGVKLPVSMNFASVTVTPSSFMLEIAWHRVPASASAACAHNGAVSVPNSSTWMIRLVLKEWPE